MANFSGLFLLVQPRIELNCINFCSANASQFSSKGASASRAHLHRNKWEVMSSLSGSNLMTISKRLGHREDETFDSCMLSADTSRRNSRADVLRRVVADRGFDRRRCWNSEGQSGVLSGRKWYPMYLTAEVPSNCPLGLTAFDRSLVLFYDGDGKIHCFEDRCPHRCNISWLFALSSSSIRSFSSGFCNTEMLGFVVFSCWCAPFWSLGQVQQQGNLFLFYLDQLSI
jgi:hypothetical protein